MKKIRCDKVQDDYVEVGFSQSGVFIAVQQDDDYSAVALNADKIRKQLKKALRKIEGTDRQEDEA